MTMTREEFDQFLSWIKSSITVRRPYKVVECACGDINCHGWRVVPRRASKKANKQRRAAA
jgi:hypothetical protein